MISAQVICNSISPQSKRLTTFRLRYPKFIHGEFMTHRLLSRNASSSRAIPVRNLIEEVRDDNLRAGPVWWGAEQKGMQSGEELTGRALSDAQGYWCWAAEAATGHAEKMVELGVHKSIVNRLLEPFSHINVVATATEWDNFFGLRLDRAAQPEMRVLAEAMWKEYDIHGSGKGPQPLKPGEWHLPFIEDEDHEEWEDLDEETKTQRLIEVSVARCARVSYQSNDTGRRSTTDEDLALYKRLLGAQPLHASPAEHQATPDDENRSRDLGEEFWLNRKEHGNFVGWRQYRKMLPGEAVAPLPEGYRK